MTGQLQHGPLARYDGAQTPGESFNISADAVRDTDGSGPNDFDGEEGAQSELVKQLFPGAQGVSTGTADGGTKAVDGAGGVATGVAAKRNSVQIPGWGAGGAGKRARVAADGAAGAVEDVAEEPGDAAEYEEAPFALMWIRMKMPRPFNHGCFGVKLRQVVRGSIELAVVSNYMVDVKFLLSACPELRRAKQMVLLHGEATSRMRGLVAEAGIPSSMQVWLPVVWLRVHNLMHAGNCWSWLHAMAGAMTARAANTCRRQLVNRCSFCLSVSLLTGVSMTTALP